MEPLKFIVLGSGSSIPTTERNHSSYIIKYNGDVFLWDCGEGTQRQLRKTGVSPLKIDQIFISHWHTDHFAGLPGLLETMKLEDRTKKLQIYAPEAEKYIWKLSQIFWNDKGFDIEAININFQEKKEHIIINDKKYIISSVPSSHSIPAVCYCFKEKNRWNIDLKKARIYNLSPGPLLQDIKNKGEITFNDKKVKIEQIADLKTGRKIVYSGDSRPSPLIEDIAKNADLLIHEATFIDEKSNNHSTVKEAAELASRARVKKLLLTHYSQRYKNPDIIKEEARKVFKNSYVARDFMEVEVI